MGKTFTTIYVDEEMIQKSKGIGFNISKICETALKDAVRQLDAPNPNNTVKNISANAFSKRVEVVPRPGFEPGTVRFLYA